MKAKKVTMTKDGIVSSFIVTREKGFGGKILEVLNKGWTIKIENEEEKAWEIPQDGGEQNTSMKKQEK